MKRNHTPVEAAAAAGISVSTLYREIGRGAIRTYQIGRRRFVAEADLSDYLASLSK